MKSYQKEFPRYVCTELKQAKVKMCDKCAYHFWKQIPFSTIDSSVNTFLQTQQISKVIFLKVEKLKKTIIDLYVENVVW